MKKIVLSVVVCMLIGVQFGFAQNTTVSNLLNDLANGHYDSVVMKMNISKEMGVMPMEGFEEMEVYTPIDDEDEEGEAIIDLVLKGELAQMIYSLKADPTYESLMQVKDEEDHVDMYVKKIGDKVKELVIFIVESGEEGDIVIVNIKGDFSEQQLSELMNQVNI